MSIKKPQIVFIDEEDFDNKIDTCLDRVNSAIDDNFSEISFENIADFFIRMEEILIDFTTEKYKDWIDFIIEHMTMLITGALNAFEDYVNSEIYEDSLKKFVLTTLHYYLYNKDEDMGILRDISYWECPHCKNLSNICAPELCTDCRDI
tara:strand:+ start:98 stop:544 length:447 start_codon:yes stop_codon:yes gene_type:complete